MLYISHPRFVVKIRQPVRFYRFSEFEPVHALKSMECRVWYVTELYRHLGSMYVTELYRHVGSMYMTVFDRIISSFGFNVRDKIT